MDTLADIDGLVVRQKKEWTEILTGFETRNRYECLDLQGQLLFQAAEVGTSFLSRMFLKALRPFQIQIVTSDGNTLLRLQRPFRFYFHEIRVYSPDDRLLGTVKREFSLLRRLYSVSHPSGEDRLELFGPILHPWTFEIRRRGQTCGKITKKWSGFGKELFTDADNFGIEFPPQAPAALKAVLLGAVFLIDFVHFERSKNR